MATFFHQLSNNLCGQLQLREQLSSIVHINRLLRWFSHSLVSKIHCHYFILREMKCYIL